MIRVVFKPWKEIVIHEAIEYELRDLVKLRILRLRSDSVAQPLVWTDGVVFSRNVLPPTEEVIREQLQGIIHFSAVEWSLMPKYRRVLKSRGITIPVVDVSNNPSLREVAKALKKRHKKS